MGCELFLIKMTLLEIDIYLLLRDSINLIYIFTFSYRCIQYTLFNLAGWQSGYAAACKAVNAGSIPASASMIYWL